MLIIKKKPLAIVAYALLLLPIVLFFGGWLQWYIGIPAALILIAGATWLIRKDYSGHDEGIQISVLHLVGIIIVFGLVVALAGIVGVGVSGYDVSCRNAIFRDLIDYDWPVVYENGNAMVYYAAFWLPAALVGKVLGWAGGLVALWAFLVLVITVSYLLIISYLKMHTPGKMWLACLFLMLFSGITFLAGALVTAWGWNLYDYPLLSSGGAYLDHQYNGESFNWLYRGNFASIQTIYNQLLLWVAVPLMLQNRKVHSYMFLGLLVLPYSPWGFLGIFPLLIFCALPWAIEQCRQKQAKNILKEVFSPANVAALITIAPIFLLYFLASSRTGGGASFGLITPDMIAAYEAEGRFYTTQTGMFGFLSFDRFELSTVIGLVLFYLTEFGVYMAFLFHKNKKKLLFWGVLVWLMLIPLMWFGTINGRDFCMNASVPPLFVLMIMLLAHMKDEVCGKPLGLRNLCLVVFVTIAFLGTTYSMLAQVEILRDHRSFAVIDDSIGTLSDKDYNAGYQNFLTDKPEDTLFFQHLARK